MKKPGAPPKKPAEPVPDAPAPLLPEAAAPVEHPVHRLRRWEVGLVILFCLGLYLPFLGEYGLWDPWETHYAEVARRMLEDEDWVRLKWQDENFRSKPVLTFWMMGAGMKILGVGDGGGYSGEMVSSSKVEWAIRLPFALWGVGGLVILWIALARLYSRRAAWISIAVLGSCPFYFMISRQAITDMPSCAMLMGSMALLALAVFDNQPLRRWRFGLTAHHLFLAVFAVVVLGQLLYFTFNLQSARWMLSRTSWIPGPWMMVPFYVGFLGLAVWSSLTCKTTRQAYMYWFYLLNGVAVLAKGPVAPALAGLTIIGYLVVTWDWKLLRHLEIPRGVILAAVVCLPWHFAIFMKDGMGWLNEYVSTHLLGRAFKGVFGDRGTFEYFLEQLGAGIWPWGCLVPGALVTLAVAGRAVTREEKLRAMFAVWAILAFAFFVFVQTKFHHYILPAVPALAVVAAFWLDDVCDGRARGVRALLLVAAALFVVTSIDLVTRQERLVHLFIFRYFDRPWPYTAPWKVDYSSWILLFAVLFGGGLAACMAPRLRRLAAAWLCVVGVAFAIFGVNVLLRGASPHWGQRKLFEAYYQGRDIHGVDLTYYGGKKLVEDWGAPRDLEVRSVIPDSLAVGDAMVVRWELRNAHEGVQEQGELKGTVSSIDEEGDRFTIAIPDGERQKIAPTVEKNRGARDDKRRFVAVNADRMIAWQLFWRGENFYSGGEIWNPRIKDMQTAFKETDNVAFLAYLRERMNQGRKFWIVTEIDRVKNLKNVLPTETAKSTLTTMGDTSNKFGVVKFTLDEGQAAAAPAPVEERPQ
jgi:4-amino-4-deoxy-L-arabinose transferase-like glycosyltransferase